MCFIDSFISGEIIYILYNFTQYQGEEMIYHWLFIISW